MLYFAIRVLQKMREYFKLSSCIVRKWFRWRILGRRNCWRWYGHISWRYDGRTTRKVENRRQMFRRLFCLALEPKLCVASAQCLAVSKGSVHHACTRTTQRNKGIWSLLPVSSARCPFCLSYSLRSSPTGLGTPTGSCKKQLYHAQNLSRYVCRT